MAKYKVTLTFESDKETPYLAANELSEAILYGACTYYEVTELKTMARFGVALDEPEKEATTPLYD